MKKIDFEKLYILMFTYVEMSKRIERVFTQLTRVNIFQFCKTIEAYFPEVSELANVVIGNAEH